MYGSWVMICLPPLVPWISGLPGRSVTVAVIQTAKTIADRSTNASRAIAASTLRLWPRFVVFISFPFLSLSNTSCTQRRGLPLTGRYQGWLEEGYLPKETATGRGGGRLPARGNGCQA